MIWYATYVKDHQVDYEELSGLMKFETTIPQKILDMHFLLEHVGEI